jgi:hypothetical protein
MHSSTPVVTPSLAKKITDMRLVGHNLDNLDEGISSFSIVIIDTTTHSSEITYQAAIKAARKYDDLVNGVTIPLDELNSVPEHNGNHSQDFRICKRMLKPFYIAIVA